MVNLILVEDDLVFRKALEETFHFQPHIHCILSAKSAEDLRQLLPERAKVDVALLDIDLPGESGIELISFLAKKYPEAEIIMLTQVEEKEVLLKALSQGATGYLLKDFSILQLPDYINSAIKGYAAISPRMARYLIEYFSPPKRQTKEMELLSPKETQVLSHLAMGKTYDETANILGISIDGVRFHVKQIYSKLNVHKRQDAITIWKLAH